MDLTLQSALDRLMAQESILQRLPVHQWATAEGAKRCCSVNFSLVRQIFTTPFIFIERFYCISACVSVYLFSRRLYEKSLEVEPKEASSLQRSNSRSTVE